MKKSIISIFAMLLCVFVYAQELPEIIPPSPEASALSEFTNVPVSHYTGLPNISVPIYTIQQKGVTIPINLNYHARGVRVSETAPRTGMGWSLAYGGSISRQVRGKGDESLNNGYLANSSHFKNYSQNLETREVVDGNETFNSSYDFYPDQFTFNAGGTNGKFVLNYNDGEPVVQSFGDVKITYTRENGFSGKIDSFLVVDGQGNKFYYGISKDGSRTAQDYQLSSGKSCYYNGNVILDPASSSSETIYSAWKLMDVETTNGELISYYYESENNTYERKVFDMHQTYTEPDPDSQGQLLGPSSVGANSLANMTNIQKIYTRISRVNNYENQLTKIKFNEGKDKINFTKSQSGREDYDGFSLDKISVYSKNKLIKSYNLNYSYTTSIDQTSSLHYLQGTTMYNRSLKRMFLKVLRKRGVKEGNYLLMNLLMTNKYYQVLFLQNKIIGGIIMEPKIMVRLQEFLSTPIISQTEELIP